VTGKTVQTENTQINNTGLQKTIHASTSFVKGMYIVSILVNDNVYKTEMMFEK